MLTPLGLGRVASWEGVLSGRSGIGPITCFDAGAFPSRIAGEVRGFDPTRTFAPREAKHLDRFVQLGVAAADEALDDAGLAVGSDEKLAERVGVYLGAGFGGVATIEATCRALVEKGPRRGISPYFVPQVIINLLAGQVSLRHHLKGPVLGHATACASGAHAIGEAMRAIERGDAVAMVAGGSEAAITPLGLGGFAAMRALSTRNHEPERASRPFDAERDGFVVAEGAGVLVLEELEFARGRGARIYAELRGYGLSADAHHITAPADDGEGAARAMRMALEDGGLPYAEVGYVNAHATGTRQGDIAETRAIRAVFGAYADRLAISSTKSMTGHLLGAAGGVEAGLTVLALAEGWLPPTSNLEHPDPACDLDYVPGRARPASCTAALSNSFGFGGANATLLFARLP